MPRSYLSPTLTFMAILRKLNSILRNKQSEKSLQIALFLLSEPVVLTRHKKEIIMPKQVLVPPGSPPPIAPFSPGTKAGNVIYTSGLLPLDKDGKLIGAGDIKAQTRALLENIKAILGAGGGTTEDVTFSQVFITDLTNFKAMKRSLFRAFQEGPSGTLLHSLRFGSA